MKYCLLALLIILGLTACSQDTIISYVCKKPAQISMHYKNERGENIYTISKLVAQAEAKKQQVILAMNGGMFTPEFAPVGLYIENGKTIKTLNNVSGGGNFGLKPNGVFYITTNNKAAICKTEDFKNDGKIKYATQSGPMLVIDGQIHPSFKKGSANGNIRNGVGVLADGSVLFAISNVEVNFFDFATFFKNKGCKNALYLDGFVSEMYCPEKNMLQNSGQFGVIIGVITTAH